MKKKDAKVEALERKVRKAKAELDYAKARKKLGLTPFETCREHNARMRREAKALPKETRQAALDAFWRGGATIKDMAASCGITEEQLVGVFLVNIKRTTYETLNKETV